jgi:hypothetical protein
LTPEGKNRARAVLRDRQAFIFLGLLLIQPLAGRFGKADGR